MHDELFAVEHRECAGPGLESPPAIPQFDGSMRRKIHMTVFARKDGRQRCSRMVLGLGLNAAVGKSCKRLDHKRRSTLSQNLEQLYRCLIWPNRDLLL